MSYESETSDSSMAPTSETGSPGETNRSRKAYAELRNRIVEGQIAPGRRLVETEIADRLGVSRTPVRSALQRLEQEGYVESAGDGERSKPVVAPLTKQDAHDLLYMLGAIEGLAARGAAELPDDEREPLVDELKELNARLEALADEDRPDRNEWYRLDTEFHGLYVDRGAGPRLRKFHASIRPQAERYIRVYVAAHHFEIDESVEEHTAVINAIEAGRPDWAEQATVENYRSAEERLRRDIDEIGERGSW